MKDISKLTQESRRHLMDEELKGYLKVIGIVTLFGGAVLSGVGVYIGANEEKKNELDSLKSDLELCKKQLKKHITSELVP